MGKTSRNKGAVYERDLAILFSRWWFGMELTKKGKLPPEHKVFGRVPTSGGWSRVNASHQGGADIIPTKDAVEKLWPFCIEAKNRKGYSFEALLQGLEGKGDPRSIMGWWRKAVEDASRVGKIPLLIWHKQGTDVDFLLFSKRLVTELFSYSGALVRLRHFELKFLDPTGDLSTDDSGRVGLVICELRDWLRLVDADAVRAWWKARNAVCEAKDQGDR